MADNPPDNCGGCRFFRREELDGPRPYGDCRRHAPRANDRSVDGDGPFATLWPQVQDCDWCGEHERP